jgi:SET domain-containing protein
MTQAPAKGKPRPRIAAARHRRIQVRRSGVHGKGVFALVRIAPGERIIEYKGERISWKEALRRHPHDPANPDHTFYFHIDDKHVIDANVGGNAARWINHACVPNCEANEHDGRIYIEALRSIRPGEELFYDYGLVIDERYTPKVKKQFECRCGRPKCRGTMLAPKR